MTRSCAAPPLHRCAVLSVRPLRACLTDALRGQVGLAGSSAIVTAAFQCLMTFYALTERDIPKCLQEGPTTTLHTPPVHTNTLQMPPVHTTTLLRCFTACFAVKLRMVLLHTLCLTALRLTASSHLCSRTLC